jgi:hypothetical protein
VEHYFTDEKHGGTGCILINAGDAPTALEDSAWIGHDLGTVSMWNDRTFESGLSASERSITVEFFAQMHRPTGAALPAAEAR